MRSLFLCTAAIAALSATASAHAAQPADQSQPHATQIQANPIGPGVPTTMPPNPANADSPVSPAMPADPNYNAGPYKGALTPAPAQAMNRTYPVCSRTLLDSCVNPGEAETGTSAAAPSPKRSRHSHHS